MSVTLSTASSSREFPKFSGDQDTVDSKSRAYIRKCMTKKKEISRVDKDILWIGVVRILLIFRVG